MTKTQKAIEVIRQAAKDGKSVQEAAKLAETATGLDVFAEERLTPRTAGQAYYDSHTREQKRAMFSIWTKGFRRELACEFIGGFGQGVERA